MEEHPASREHPPIADLEAEVGALLTRSPDAETLCRAVLDRVVAALPCMGALLILAEERGQGRIVASAGQDAPPPGTLLRDWPALAGAASIDDLDERPDLRALLPLIRARRARSMVIAPIKLDGARLGSLILAAERPRHFGAHQVRWVAAFCATLNRALANATDLAARALERARLHGEEDTREQERARAEEDLARLRSDFVDTINHELRTPLTAILGYSEILESRWSGASEVQRLGWLARIKASAARQQRLVDDLLLTSNLSQEMLDLTPVPLDLPTLVTAAVAELQVSYPEQRVALHGPQTLVVRADPRRTRQIVANLLDNAAKFSPWGGEVSVRWRAEGGLAVLRVRDQGPGVPQAGRQRLFERFGRLEGSQMRGGHVGAGLGLYLGRMLARAMGGDLDLEESGSDGSTFSLRLPLDRGAGAAGGHPAT